MSHARHTIIQKGPRSWYWKLELVHESRVRDDDNPFPNIPPGPRILAEGNARSLAKAEKKAERAYHRQMDRWHGQMFGRSYERTYAVPHIAGGR
jgi:hypothetical protein